MKKKIDEKI